MSKTRQCFPLFLILAFSVAALGAKKKQVEHAPLPAKVLSAKTVYIQNDSGFADIADKAYSQLKSWGRYRVVDTKQHADLVLIFTATSEQTEGTTPTHVSTYNYQTGAWTSGTATAPSTDTWHYTQVKLVDPETDDVAWADRRIWGKHSATEELIKALRERVEEQEKAAR